MRFQARAFSLAKDLEDPEQYQDAYGSNPDEGLAVVADGVASAIFSGRWAAILAEAVLAAPPEPGQREAFAAWLARQRQDWSEQIDTSGLAWFQKAKLPVGAFSTLLWVRLLPLGEQQQEGAFGGYRLLGHAWGDSCLFHVRDGELVRTFPVQKADELQADPVVLGSVDLNRDHLMQFATLDELCYPDDLLLLTTDAVAEWALRGYESGQPPAWESYFEMTQAEWQQHIVALREQRQMRYDDATLLLLRVCREGVPVDEPQETDEGPEAAVEEAVEEPWPPVIVVDAPPQPGRAAQGEPVAADDDWKEKFKAASQNLAEGIELASDQAVRGWKRWSKRAAEKIRQKTEQVRKKLKRDEK